MEDHASVSCVVTLLSTDSVTKYLESSRHSWNDTMKTATYKGTQVHFVCILAVSNQKYWSDRTETRSRDEGVSLLQASSSFRGELCQISS